MSELMLWAIYRMTHSSESQNVHTATKKRFSDKQCSAFDGDWINSHLNEVFVLAIFSVY